MCGPVYIDQIDKHTSPQMWFSFSLEALVYIVLKSVINSIYSDESINLSIQ